MTRAELIDSLAKQFVYNNPQTVDAAVREIFEIMIETLSLGERIEINLSRRRVVHFKPGVELRDRVNSFNSENEKVQE